MITRFLDWLDESAQGVIRLAYLMAGVIGVASYFSDGNVPHALTLFLAGILPWAMAGALEIHTYITARRVRACYQEANAATLGSDEHEKAHRQFVVNLWILGGLLAFSMYNQLQYLAQTWTPPHTPLTPPGPWAYLIRATVGPAAFMAAAFLSPMGEGMAAQLKSANHHLARLAFNAASAQWRRRLREMQRTGEDITGALVHLVEDPAERKVIATIHAAMHPTTETARIVDADEPQIEPPTPDGPAPTRPRRRRDTGRRVDETEELKRQAKPHVLKLARAKVSQRDIVAALKDNFGIEITQFMVREIINDAAARQEKRQQRKQQVRRVS